MKPAAPVTRIIPPPFAGASIAEPTEDERNFLRSRELATTNRDRAPGHAGNLLQCEAPGQGVIAVNGLVDYFSKRKSPGRAHVSRSRLARRQIRTRARACLHKRYPGAG